MSTRTKLAERHDAAWRNPAQIASQWPHADAIDPRLLTYKASPSWWEIVERCGITLLVTREYEHLVMAASVVKGKPYVSYMAMPHPSGIAVNTRDNTVYIASTRNPNQIFDLKPVTGSLGRRDSPEEEITGRPLIPVRSRFLPGCLYIHDLAIVDRALHASAVGQNAIIRIDDDGTYKRVWWPKCVERRRKPVIELNHIQLNSIAAGRRIESSYFSASSSAMSTRRPGHKNYPVKGRGVVFSGKTREPVVTGLTRPHSARLHARKLWVNNSGYGELCVAKGGNAECIARLPGWTRGLGFADGVAFVGVSRVIPRFRQYAPGLNVESSECGIYAVDSVTGQVLGSMVWPYGNQIFAVEPVSADFCTGFPFSPDHKTNTNQVKKLFYAFSTDH